MAINTNKYKGKDTLNKVSFFVLKMKGGNK